MKTISRSFFTCFDKTRVILNGRRGCWRWYYLGTLYYWDFEKIRGRWYAYYCDAGGHRELYCRRLNLSEALQVAKNTNEHQKHYTFSIGGQ